MRRKGEAGFTLIEVVVVVAVIAILAAVLAPYIAKYIDDSKTAKARSEVQVIGGALTSFYKDTGMWPGRDAEGANVAVLYTGSVTPAAAAIFTANPPVTPPVNNWNGAVAPLDNSLLTNGNGNAYPANGDMIWRGPYVGGAIPADPWGKPYVINVTAIANAPVWVLSAGPNGKIQTARTDNVTAGDDVGVRVR